MKDDFLMKNLTARSIEKAVSGELRVPSSYDEKKLLEEISGVSTDNRKIEPGNLFIPIKGERFDAHEFIESAVSSGASLFLSERDFPDNRVPYIKVNDTKKALRDLAAFYREQFDIPFIGIIGSVGKTSTKEMTSSVLSEKFNVLKTEGNFNNDIGLPLTIFRVRPYHTAAVVEMGISDFHEMDVLGNIAKPDIVIMTNIGECHLENLIDRDGVLKAKSEVLKYIKPGGALILNHDDDKLRLIDKEKLNDIKVLYYGTEKSEDLFIYSKEKRELSLKEGVKICLESKNGDIIEETIPLPGLHNVYNAMAAASLGLLLGLDVKSIENGIKNVKTIGGRSNIIKKDGITIIDDCYNANPVSMKASLSVLKNEEGRRIAVLGDMGELGENESALHYEIGKTAANSSDIIFLSGALSLETKRGIEDEKKDIHVYHFNETKSLIAALKKKIRKGDTVLIKASHFMHFDLVVKSLTE